MAKEQLVPMWVLSCVSRLFHWLQVCSFLASVVFFVVGETGLEVGGGLLVGGAGACSLVGGIESWPSGGHYCLKGYV